MAHAYSALYKFPVTGLRFFTVYGPWGRPDMALFIFTKSILEGKPINIFNNGEMLRDFTYVDDIARVTTSVLDKPASPNSRWNGASPDPATSFAPYKLYNVGNHQPVNLNIFIETLEECLGKKAIKNYLPLQPGDVHETYADISELAADFDFKPVTELKEGVRKFVEWYRGYYNK
jgi:UDP-glucuronate 4-epimerase